MALVSKIDKKPDFGTHVAASKCKIIIRSRKQRVFIVALFTAKIGGEF
jgi:hypothetical protein